MRVLLVEDDTNHALLVTRCLKQEFGMGVMVETAQTGEEAYERLTLGDSLDEPDIVLMDVKLPGMSGLEVLHKLREAGDNRPIVLVTSSQELQIAIKALRFGANDFVTKGSDFPENLVGAVIRAQEHARLQEDLAEAQERIAEMEASVQVGHNANPINELSKAYKATQAQLKDIGVRLKLQGEKLCDDIQDSNN